MAKTTTHADYTATALTLTTAAQPNITSLGTLSSLSVGGTLAATGVVTANAGVVVDNITIDGTEIDLSSGDLTIDVAGGINLDSDGGEISFKDAGTEIGKFNNSSSDFSIEAGVQDKDILFKGNDGGSGITALTLDMSDAGTAIFNDKVGVNTTNFVTTGAKLQVKGTSAVPAISGSNFAGSIFSVEGTSTVNISMGTTGASTYYGWIQAHDAGNGTNYKLNLNPLGGNVGIGTTSPTGKLEIAATGTNAAPHIKLVESGDTREFNIYNDGSGNGHLVLADSDDDTSDTEIVLNDNGIITMLTGNSERMRIDSSGNVGIGTTSPSQKLHVDGEIKATSADITDSAGNTSIGYGALNNLTSGDSCVAVGYEALEDVTSGIHNVGIGYRAGMNITTGQYNVAVGNYALSTNTGGGWNTCIGYGAGNTMSGNDHNTCIGRNAGYSITSGGSNTIIGSQAGDAQTTAHNNTFVGTRAGTSATTGNGYNTAIGVDALEDCTTGSFNVSLGTNTIKNVTTGENNIGVGYRAGNAGQPGGQITSQSNIACIGDTAISSLNCQVSLSVASDQRDKTDFTDLDIGLDFVKQMKPYTFRWDKRSNYVDWDANPDTDLDTITHDGTHKEDQLDIGFKAQDVEALEEAAGYDKDNKTNLTYALSPDGKIYSMKYEKLVPVLVKAIQELEEKVRVLENK